MSAGRQRGGVCWRQACAPWATRQRVGSVSAACRQAGGWGLLGAVARGCWRLGLAGSLAAAALWRLAASRCMDCEHARTGGGTGLAGGSADARATAGLEVAAAGGPRPKKPHYAHKKPQGPPAAASLLRGHSPARTRRAAISARPRLAQPPALPRARKVETPKSPGTTPGRRARNRADPRPGSRPASRQCAIDDNVPDQLQAPCHALKKHKYSVRPSVRPSFLRKLAACLCVCLMKQRPILHAILKQEAAQAEARRAEASPSPDAKSEKKSTRKSNKNSD